MRRVRVSLIGALVAAAAVLAATAHGQEAPTSRLGAGIEKTGLVTLGYFGDPGSVVFLDERVAGKVQRLGALLIPAKGFARLDDATTWRCDRLLRSFESTELKADGTRAKGSFDVRTPSCARRFKLGVRSRAKLGRVAIVRVIDQWNVGAIKTRLCIKPPQGTRTCRPLRFTRAIGVRSRRFRATKRGLWRIELRVREHRVRAVVSVGTRAPRVKPVPVILATGDSTMQGIDSFLADRLGDAAQVRSDTHIGTGVSQGKEWLPRAAQQATRFKPDTTVISIGAAEGDPMRTPGGAKVVCCGPPWTAEYTRRVGVMMTSYLRGGKAKVLWLSIPLPRSFLHAAVTRQVNSAILSAAAGRAGVKVLRLDSLFTPNGYRDVVRYRGQDVRVRAVDTVHLSAAGTFIAAEAVQKALRTGW